MIQDRDNVETNYIASARIAGFLFITATAATMLSQILIEPFLQAPEVVSRVAEDRDLFVVSALLEVVNALASAGIAFALFPILRRCVEGLAVAYVGLRVIEAALGIVATIGLLMLHAPGAVEDTIAIAGRDLAFLLLLLVFTIGTMVLYPLLFTFRLVPHWLSIWGLVGGAMLFVSVLMILFGRIEIGSTLDMILSLPIWINEMVLALWLIFQGVDLTEVHRKLGNHPSVNAAKPDKVL